MVSPSRACSVGITIALSVDDRGHVTERCLVDDGVDDVALVVAPSSASRRTRVFGPGPSTSLMREGRRRRRCAPCRRPRRSLRRVARTSRRRAPTPDGPRRSGSPTRCTHHGATAHIALPVTLSSARPRRGAKTRIDTSTPGPPTQAAITIELGHQEEVHRVDGQSAQRVEVLDDGEHALVRRRGRPRATGPSVSFSIDGSTCSSDQRGRSMPSRPSLIRRPDRTPARVWKKISPPGTPNSFSSTCRLASVA